MKAPQRIIIDFNLHGDEGELDHARAEIAAQIKTTLKEDFGPDAWGGYEGPVAKSIKVHHEPAK